MNRDKMLRQYSNEMNSLLIFAKRHGFSLNTFLSSLSWVVRCGIFVLDENGFSIGGYLLPYIDSEPAEALLHFGVLPAELFSRLKEEGSAEPGGTVHRLLRRDIPDTGTANVLLVGVQDAAVPEDVIAACVLEYVQHRIHGLIGESADISLLSQSLNDILRGNITSMDSIKKILSDERDKPYYISAVVEFDDGITNHKRYLHFINRLREIVVSCKPTIFKGKIVALLRAEPSEEAQLTGIRPKWETSVFREGYDYAALSSLLADEAASMAVNAALHELTLLPDAVASCMDVADISKKFKVDDKYERIFRFDNYQSIVIAKHFFERYLAEHSVRALKLFIFPELIPLLRYDYLHQQNLSVVLYKYILYRYDTAETAKSLFMHRNTVYNKIKQIQEIIGVNFSNTMYMSMIMDSLKLYFFLTSYFNIDAIEVMLGKMPPKLPEKRSEPKQ